VIPSIYRQPVRVTEEITHNARFFVGVRGHGPFRYQWYHNRKTIYGAGAYLYINNLALHDAGSYYCRICNPDGHCLTSYTVYLTVTG